MTVWRGNWRLNFWWFAYSARKHVRRVRKVCIFTNVFALNFVKVETNYWHLVHIHERANTWEETVKGRRLGGWEAWMQIRSEDVTLLKLTTIHHTRVHRFLHITSTSSSLLALSVFNIHGGWYKCVGNTICLKPNDKLPTIDLSLTPWLL